MRRAAASIDPPDPGMGVRRAQHDRMRHAVEGEVVEIAALPGQEPESSRRFGAAPMPETNFAMRLAHHRRAEKRSAFRQAAGTAGRRNTLRSSALRSYVIRSAGRDRVAVAHAFGQPAFAPAPAAVLGPEHLPDARDA